MPSAIWRRHDIVEGTPSIRFVQLKKATPTTPVFVNKSLELTVCKSGVKVTECVLQHKVSTTTVNVCTETQPAIDVKQMLEVFHKKPRRHTAEGVRSGSHDLTVMKDSIRWLDKWERELQSGAIMKEIFLTQTTAEGLRVTMLSTLALTEYLLGKCDFKYVLTAKFNQDPLERYFGKTRQAACDNDHPDMPNFLQLYRMLSVYSLLKPPTFGNCALIEEKQALDLSEFRKNFSEN
ncbi:hypothetical protein HPB50_001820 [Hyalomma asiaticum]|uniref:Uncharacterized protein n=1 Tax=Hyalomma asiaticum TaxID=266040 RepID=A0ACB7SSI0_HYAAI|nr:hypothetical protein HPB50_001820 [Hyalomma asiaticum]